MLKIVSLWDERDSTVCKNPCCTSRGSPSDAQKPYKRLGMVMMPVIVVQYGTETGGLLGLSGYHPNSRLMERPCAWKEGGK